MHGEHHVVQPKTYMAVFGFLMLMLFATVAAATKDMGALNLPIAMVIAAAKTLAIMALFMHLKFVPSLTRFYAGSALIWLALLFIFTFCDYFTRHWFSVPRVG